MWDQRERACKEKQKHGAIRFIALAPMDSDSAVLTGLNAPDIMGNRGVDAVIVGSNQLAHDQDFGHKRDFHLEMPC